MSVKQVLFRSGAAVRHALTAWNTGGEGIHSPRLFELVRFVLRSNERFYSWQHIEKERRRLLRDPRVLHVTDYGAGPGGQRGQTESGVQGGVSTYERTVADIARKSLERPKVGQALFRIVEWMGRERQEAIEMIELGTSLGISSAYMASPARRDRLTTFEGCAQTAAVAQEVWQALGLTNISCIEGNIDTTLADTLYRYARERKDYHIDIAYLDANHTTEATLRYFATLLPYLRAHSICIIDDIHHSEAMERAWRDIQQMRAVTTTMDYYHFGLVFFDTHYLRKHYKLRL
ncbi:MAG: class I SAM-dependent methyltransferase [Paludibacteraceae bacterium]|nr:class I SAM-dependent methyltransferase [Paludibacteraceae bacterium]